MVPRAEVIELEMTVQEALRMIISLGVVVPEWRRKELPVAAPAVEVTEPEPPHSAREQHKVPVGS